MLDPNKEYYESGNITLSKKSFYDFLVTSQFSLCFSLFPKVSPDHFINIIPDRGGVDTTSTPLPPLSFYHLEDGYEFFARRRLVTLFLAPNYCGEFDNAGGMISVDEKLMCSFQILKPSSRAARFAQRPQQPQS